MLKTMQAQGSLFGCRERGRIQTRKSTIFTMVTNFHSSITLLYMEINIVLNIANVGVTNLHSCIETNKKDYKELISKLTSKRRIFCYPDFVSIAVSFNGVKDDENNLEAPLLSLFLLLVLPSSPPIFSLHYLLRQCPYLCLQTFS